jgi:hypothetical protein
VPVLARVIEAAGIPCVTVTMMPVLAEKYRTSRVLGVEFPFGHSFGVVGETAMQTRALSAALDLLVTATEPETRVDLDETWPGDPKQAYKDWQPSEPSPIVKHSIEAIRQARRESANPDS